MLHSYLTLTDKIEMGGNYVEQHFKRELSLSQLIAMAAGGMIAAWMVEITY